MPMYLHNASYNHKDQDQQPSLNSLIHHPQPLYPHQTSSPTSEEEVPQEEEDPLPLSPFFYPIDLPVPTPTVISDDLSEASSHLIGMMSDSMPSMPRPEPLEGSLTQDLVVTTNNNNNNTSQEEDSQRCLMDFCEWWCHKIITANTNDANLLKEYQEELTKACDNLFSSDTQGALEKPTFGRLDNRLRLSTLSGDVALLQPPQSTSTQSAWPLHQQWKSIEEELILLKNLLLRQDANQDTVLVAQEEQHPNATPNLELEQHELFGAHYKGALQLLQVQYHLTLFHSRLVLAQPLKGDNKRVRQAIDDYEKHINNLFTTVKTAVEKPAVSDTSSSSNEREVNLEDVSVSGDEQEDHEVQSVTSHDVRALPSELVGFLLKDLYQSSQNKNQQQQSQQGCPLATRLLKHVESILTGSGKYSHTKTQTAVRTLLEEWQELVLEQPMLVQLGYHQDNGVASEKEVSPRKRQAEAEEDAMLRRLSLQCGSGGLPLDNVSDIGEEDEEEDDEQHAPPQKKRRTASPSPSDVSDEVSTTSSSSRHNHKEVITPESQLPKLMSSPSSSPPQLPLEP